MYHYHYHMIKTPPQIIWVCIQGNVNCPHEYLDGCITNQTKKITGFDNELKNHTTTLFNFYFQITKAFFFINAKQKTSKFKRNFRYVLMSYSQTVVIWLNVFYMNQKNYLEKCKSILKYLNTRVNKTSNSKANHKVYRLWAAILKKERRKKKLTLDRHLLWIHGPRLPFASPQIHF